LLASECDAAVGVNARCDLGPALARGVIVVVAAGALQLINLADK